MNSECRMSEALLLCKSVYFIERALIRAQRPVVMKSFVFVLAKYNRVCVNLNFVTPHGLY